MNTTSNPPAHLGDIVARWKSSARAGGWRAMGDWSASSVPAVATAAIPTVATHDTASAATPHRWIMIQRNWVVDDVPGALAAVERALAAVPE